jgi:PIN domain nuclease of toxin-antitoxin system
MILLDTHILVWWLDQPTKLSPAQLLAIKNSGAIMVSVISFWEIAKLVENHRLVLNCPVLDWLHAVLAHTKVKLVPLSPEIIVLSTQLPGAFHKDPADQLIVATSMQMSIPLLTQDVKILRYSHISSIA